MLDIKKSIGKKRTKYPPFKQNKLTNNNRSKFWPLICTSLGLTNMKKYREKKITHAFGIYYEMKQSML